jgi:tetratricopeptide (TPR) repeat protein
MRRWAIALTMVGLMASRAEAFDRSELVPLPLPNLSTMEDATRRRLESLQNRVAKLETSGSDAELAEAFGTLGMYYIAHHLNDAAEAAFVDAGRLSPGDFRWPYYLGFVYQMVGKLELEREAYERALELRPGDLPARLHLAELLLELGDNEEAYREFQHVLDLSPSEAAAFGGLGKAATALGRTEEAVEHFTRAVELQPSATMVHYQLALAYRKLGDMEAARAHLDLRGDRDVAFADALLAAIEPLKNENVVEVLLEMATKPEEHDDRNVVIYAATYLGDLPNAVGQIHEAIVNLTPPAGTVDPSSEEAYRNRLVRARLHLAIASLRLERGNIAGARNQIEAALALVPEMRQATLMLGYVLEKNGDIAAALERYSAVLEIDPDDSYALRARSSARMDLHLDREAIEDLERLCDLGLERDGTRIRLAVSYLRLGEIDQARENYRKALDLNLEPSDAAQVHHHLGIIESRSGSPDRAAEEYRTALALDPNLVLARLDLGVALGQLGRWEEAAQMYRQVVEAEPDNVRARLGEAEALASLDRWREACQRLEEGWQAIPESVELLHALARLLASADDAEVRDGERAMDLARRTLRAGTTPSRLETLAMASAEAGLLDEAVTIQRRAIQMMIWEGRSEALPELEANLARYRAGLTCCADAPSSE